MNLIGKMLKERGSMPLNEFHAAACALVPAEATRYGKFSRFTFVRKWMQQYAKRFVIQDDHIKFCNDSNKPSPFASTKGHKMLMALKEKGCITQEQSGFTPKTWNSYKKALKRLGWVSYKSSNELIWCGPDDAEWVSVGRLNNRYKQKTKR